MMSGRPPNPIIVALDVPTAEDAVRLAESVGDHVGGFKVGLRLLHGPGPAVIAALQHLAKPVLADAKLHDIPSQTAAAAAALGRWGARWVTVHAGGGAAMLGGAVAGLHDTNPASGVLAVSVLTSLDGASLATTGVTSSPGRLVARRAKLAAATGCEGVVCSPRELSIVGEVAPRLIKVTPGIRSEDSDDDQARTATAAEAVRWGASWIVVGRPITAAADPAAAAALLRSELVGSD